ncbi:uncharacterized protein EV154DRAFT_509588 [Mucor mucedo]|uniref:uncharacterized protein n=1 Tax=Mucor mucedo TaxID=29922 RepID=UPI00221F8E85|nr:uncharacterized protein EV154DRAFT_509588 [Mucor mucedo]KAI7890965.1 hypothetical protein EV154DRAFT_509588 [Mucor mucedo]
MNRNNQTATHSSIGSYSSSSVNRVRVGSTEDISASTPVENLSSSVSHHAVRERQEYDSDSDYQPDPNDSDASEVEEDEVARALEGYESEGSETEVFDGDLLNNEDDLDNDDDIVANHGSSVEISEENEVTMPFAEFVEKCAAATSMTERLDLMFNGQITTIDNVQKKIIVDLETDCDSPTLCEVNIDAFISYPLKELPIMPKTRWKLSLSPNWKHALTRLDFGHFTFRGERDYVKNYPHTLLLEAFSEACMNIHVLFPNMKKMKLGVSNARRMLGSAAQKTFTDRLLVPAIRRVLICSRANRSGGSYGEAIGTGFHMTVPKFLLGSELKLLVQSMRDIAKESADLAPYRHFVFVVSSFGFKSPIYGPDYTSILDTMVDWSQLDPQRCLVDIGLNLFAESEDGRPLVSFVKDEKVQAMGKRFGGPTIKTDFYGMSLGSFGGFSGKGRSGNVFTPSKVMVYNDIKYPFTMSNPGVNGKVSGPWIPEEMRNTFRHHEGHHLKNMRWYNARVSEYQGHQFTTRLEVRVPAISATTAYVDVLVAKLKSSLADEAFIHIDSGIYLQYVGLMANLISDLAEKCLGSVLLQSFSGLYLSAYMLNNLIHSDQSLTDSSKFVSASRCRKNRLCFLPGAFAVDGDRVMFGHTFDSTSIKQAFPGAVIFDSTEQYMSSRFQDGYVRGTNVPEAFYDLFNNTETTLEGLLSTSSNAFPLAPITCPTLHAYSELISDFVMPIEKAFDHCPLFLYDISNIATVRNVYNVNQGLMQYGFGTKFAAYFLEQFWAEYITFLKDGDCYLDVLGFSNVPSKAFLSKVDAKRVAEPMCITERMYFLLPLPDRDSCRPADIKKELTAYMDGKGIDVNWKSFGTRAWYLELFANPFIGYDVLSNFHSLLMVGCLLACKYLPTSTKSRLYRRQEGVLSVRKASRFDVAFEELNMTVFNFLCKYSVDNQSVCELLDSNPLPPISANVRVVNEESNASVAAPKRYTPIKRRRNW